SALAELEPFTPLRPEVFDTAGYYLARAQVEMALHRNPRASLDSSVAAYHRRLAARPDEAFDRMRLSQAFAGLGMRMESLEESRRALQLLPVSRDGWEGPDLLLIHMQNCLLLGDRERAVEVALQWVAILPGNRLLARSDPRFAPIRHDPRFSSAI